MKSEQEVAISKIIDIVIGGTPKTSKPEYWGGTIKWASAKDISNCKGRYIYETEKRITQEGLEKSAAKLLPKNTIVITSRGTVGEMCLLPYPMSFNQTCYGLITKKGVDPLFLFYKLKTLMGKINSLSYGTVFDTITKRTFDDLRITLPPLLEQQKIASILSALDDKIELNNQMNRTLEEIASAIFKSWFVYFEPFRDGEFVDSELGPIPEEWKVGELGDICNVNMGQSPPSATYNTDGKGLPFYQGIRDFSFKYPTTSVYCSEPKKIAYKDDILLSVRAPVGEVNVAFENCCIGRGLSTLCLKKGRNNVLYYLIKRIQSEWRQFEGGTTFTSINKGDISKFSIVIPPSNIVDQFNELVSQIDEKVLTNTLENNTLVQIRDAFLPKLLSGEIRVNLSENNNLIKDSTFENPTSHLKEDW